MPNRIAITPDQIRRFKVSPKAFRESLLIDTGRGIGLFKPDPWQAENLAALDPLWMRVAGIDRNLEGPKFAWIGRGRGHSKTLDEAIQLTGAIAFSRRQLSGVAAAGSKDQAKFIRDAVLRLVMLNPWLKQLGLIKVQNYRVFNPRTKSEVDIISSDAPSSFGATPDFILCDELTHWKNDDLWVSLLSSAAKRPHCALIIMTNAGYENTWQWRVLQDAIKFTGDWVYRDLDGPVASWITAADLTKQERLLTRKAFARLWLNKWQVEAGDALDSSDITACVRHETGMFGDEKEWEFIAGLDLSTKRHRSALVFFGIQPIEHRVRLAYCRSWKPDPFTGRINLVEIQKEIVDQGHRFHMAKLCYDPHQAALMAQQLEQLGFRTEEMPFAGTNLTRMATTLLESFKGRQVELFDHREMIDDLKKLNIIERSFGFKIEASEDEYGHADLGLAFAIGLPAAVEMASIAPIRPFSDRPVMMTLDGMRQRLAELERLEPSVAVTPIFAADEKLPAPEKTAVAVAAPRFCPDCNGTGRSPTNSLKVCETCGGVVTRDICSLALEECGIALTDELPLRCSA